MPRAPSLEELFEEFTTEHARTRSRDADSVPSTGRGGDGPRLSIAGCLVRIVGLVSVLIVLAIIFLFLLFGGFIVN